MTDTAPNLYAQDAPNHRIHVPSTIVQHPDVDTESCSPGVGQKCVVLTLFGYSTDGSRMIPKVSISLPLMPPRDSCFEQPQHPCGIDSTSKVPSYRGYLSSSQRSPAFQRCVCHVSEAFRFHTLFFIAPGCPLRPHYHLPCCVGRRLPDDVVLANMGYGLSNVCD